MSRAHSFHKAMGQVHRRLGLPNVPIKTSTTNMNTPEQNDDPWFDAKTAPEAFLQQELRKAQADVRMTLRDYFAAKSMQGLLANSGGPIQSNSMQGWDLTNCTDNDIATVAYRMADAMLKARQS